VQCGDKVWKKKEATYREAEVHVYDERGLLAPVDDLAEAVQPGQRVVEFVRGLSLWPFSLLLRTFLFFFMLPALKWVGCGHTK